MQEFFLKFCLLCHWTALQSKSYHCKCIKRFSWSLITLITLITDYIDSLLLKKEMNYWEMMATYISVQTDGCSISLVRGGRLRLHQNFFISFCCIHEVILSFRDLKLFSLEPYLSSLQFYVFLKFVWIQNIQYWRGVSF